MSETRSPEEVLREAGLADPTTQLADYIRRQRWFSGRDRQLAHVDVEDAGTLEGEPLLVPAMLRVSYTEGGSDLYHVPLAVRRAGAQVEGVVAEGSRGGDAVVVSDALLDDAAGSRFWQLLGNRRMQMARGELAGVVEPGVESDSVAPVHHLPRDQSNTMLVRDDSELLKCFRRLEGVSSPEFEMLQALKRAGFTHIPAPSGVIEYRVEGQEPVVVAMAQPFLHNATDGWALAMTSLRDIYAEAEQREGGPPDDATIRELVDDQGSDFTPEAERLGTVVAEMHLALSREGVPEGLRAEVADAARLRAWATEMEEDLAAFSETEAARSVSVPALRARIEAVRRLRAEDGRPPGGLAIRVHGDLHLGQTTRTDSGWMILDFEGEPSRTVEARRRRASPLRDVAGMLRSFDYAAAVALLDRADPDDADWAMLQRYADTWAVVNREAFWSAYVAAVGDAPLLPSPAQVPRLLEAYLVQKALYEVAYEQGHRPDWAWIPLRFLETMK